VRCHNPQPGGFDVEEVDGLLSPAVGHLGGDVDGEVVPVFGVGVAGDYGDGIALKGHDGHALVLESPPDDDVGAGQRVAVAIPATGGDVRAEFLEQQRRTRLRCRLGIDHGGDRLVVDDDLLGGVGGGRPALGGHHSHHVADEANLLPGQRGTLDPGMHDHEAGGDGDVEVGGGEHPGHPRHPRRGGGIDSPKFGVGHRRPNEDEVEHTRDFEVVDIVRPSEEDVGVLDSADGIAQQRSVGRHCPVSLRGSPQPAFVYRDTAEKERQFGGAAVTYLGL
jgi:hypothetical protein